MRDRRSRNRRGLAALGIFLAWAAVYGALVFAVLGYLERFGSDRDQITVSGTAHIESCESSWYGAPYTCRATVVFNDRYVQGSTWTEQTTVSAQRPLSGEVAVERRRSPGRGSSDHKGRVYEVGYPVQSYTIWVGVGAFILFVVSLVVPRKIIKKVLPAPPPPEPRDENAPAPGAVPLGEDGRPLKRRRKRR